MELYMDTGEAAVVERLGTRAVLYTHDPHPSNWNREWYSAAALL